MRLLSVVAFAVFAAGCGASTHAGARSQTVAIGERFRCGGLAIEVASLRVGGGRWVVRASIRDAARGAFEIGRPHSPRGTYFGLARPGVAHPGLRARRFDPPLPRRLDAGVGWSGTFSGRGDVAPGVPVGVVLGRFSRPGEAGGFDCTTDHGVRLR